MHASAKNASLLFRHISCLFPPSSLLLYLAACHTPFQSAALLRKLAPLGDRVLVKRVIQEAKVCSPYHLLRSR